MAQSSYNHRNRKRNSNNGPAAETAAVEAFIVGFAQVIGWIFRSLFGKPGSKGGNSIRKAELARLAEAWQDVELHVLQSASQHQAISEADKIFDNALRVLGAPGETMADRLRAFKGHFNDSFYQEIWDAHKLRNTLAHEVGVQVSPQQATVTVTTFRKALYQLGVLS
ncbi:MAG: hypothetical protein WCO52_04515 [bacterium]